MKICDEYVCLACVFVGCPAANLEEDIIRDCKDCPSYRGCKDCVLSGTKFCVKSDRQYKEVF